MIHTKKIAFLFFICFGLLSFKSDKSKILLKRWILVDFRTPRLERNFKQRGISTERREKVIGNLIQGSYVDFRSDGTYEVSLLGSEPEIMYWQLNDDDTKLLVRKKLDQESKPIDIEVLEKKRLILIIPDIEDEYTHMYFVPDGNVEASVEDN